MAKRKAAGSTRYASYARCSTDDQKHGDFTTVDVQKELNLKHIVSLAGTAAGEYADEGKSGTNLNRADWKRLFADAQDGKFDAVVVTYMSRLGRGDAYVIAEYELKKAGVAVIAVHEKFSEDLAGYVTKRMTIMMDGMYPKMVSQWTKTKMEQMVAHGYRCGGTLPFGYSTVYVSDPVFSQADKEPPKRLVVNVDEAPFVQRAFEVYAETGNYERVREYLTGVTPRSWSLNNVIYLLNNEAYRGVLVFGEWRNDKAHEGIVSEELWEATREVLRDRVRAPKKKPLDDAFFYLRGIVHCSHCSTKMTPANHHGRTAPARYYECIACTKAIRSTCPVKRVNAGSLHQAVLLEIKRAAEHPTRMTEIIREAVKAVPVPEKLDPQLTAIQRRIRDTEKKIRNCTAAIENGADAIRPLLTRIEELETVRVSLEGEKAKLEKQKAESEIRRPDVAHVQALWSRFGSLWEAATEKEREELLPLLVERVEMKEKERGFCRLKFAVQKPRFGTSATSEYVAIKCKLGAGVGLEPTTFGL